MEFESLFNVMVSGAAKLVAVVEAGATCWLLGSTDVLIIPLI